MNKVKGIARYLVNRLVERTLNLSQGRNVGCFAFVDEDGYIAAHGELVDGGLNGIPAHAIGKVTSMKGKSLIEGLKQPPTIRFLSPVDPVNRLDHRCFRCGFFQFAAGQYRSKTRLASGGDYLSKS